MDHAETNTASTCSEQQKHGTQHTTRQRAGLFPQQILPCKMWTGDSCPRAQLFAFTFYWFCIFLFCSFNEFLRWLLFFSFLGVQTPQAPSGHANLLAMLSGGIKGFWQRNKPWVKKQIASRDSALLGPFPITPAASLSFESSSAGAGGAQ